MKHISVLFKSIYYVLPHSVATVDKFIPHETVASDATVSCGIHLLVNERDAPTLLRQFALR